MIYAAIFLGGLAILALAVLHRLWRDWKSDLDFWRAKAARAHAYHQAMRRVRPSLYSESRNTN